MLRIFFLPLPHVSHSPVCSTTIDNLHGLGFTVSIPLKQFRRSDTMSWAEIVFEWDVLHGDFYDCVCAQMDLDPREVTLGYKFESDPKKNMIQLPQDDPDIFDAMLEKIKDCISHARTRAVVLEIYNLVCYI